MEFTCGREFMRASSKLDPMNLMLGEGREHPLTFFAPTMEVGEFKEGFSWTRRVAARIVSFKLGWIRY